MRDDMEDGAVFIFAMVALVVIVGGYGLNVQNLFEYAANSKEFILSAIGLVVFPLGIITGWIF